MRIYDGRIGKFLSVDPITAKYPSLTPYQFASNSPTSGIDRDGLEFVNTTTGKVDYQLTPSNLSIYQKNNSFGPWIDLLKFTVDDKVLKQANERMTFGAAVQKIQDAAGSELNLDYYSITIHKLPIGWEKAKDVLSEVRTNFFAYVNTESMKFSADNVNEQKKWNSSNPTSAVMAFDQTILNGFYTEGASVMASGSTDDYWTFSTMSTLFDRGGHPVSGTRQFGLTTNADGTFTFFVRGADRLGGTPDAVGNALGGGKLMWDGADAIWRGLMKNVANFINQNGGSATINPVLAKRLDWKKDFVEKADFTLPVTPSSDYQNPDDAHVIK